MPLICNNEYLLLAYKKGYRIVNGQIYYCGSPVKALYRKTTGYYAFSFRDLEGTVRWVRVHRLVAYQKYGDKMLADGVVVRHKDNNKINNLEENILIGTQGENMMDNPPENRLKYAINAANYVKKHNHADIIKMRESGKSYGQIMAATGISSKGTISYILNSSREVSL